jgi:hypothetical protein
LVKFEIHNFFCPRQSGIAKEHLMLLPFKGSRQINNLVLEVVKLQCFSSFRCLPSTRCSSTCSPSCSSCSTCSIGPSGPSCPTTGCKPIGVRSRLAVIVPDLNKRWHCTPNCYVQFVILEKSCVKKFGACSVPYESDKKIM